MTKPRAPNYAPGFDIHQIQARKAMEDRDSWRAGKLVHIGKKSVDIEVDGVVKRYVCHRAPEMGAALCLRLDDSTMVESQEKQSVVLNFIASLTFQSLQSHSLTLFLLFCSEGYFSNFSFVAAFKGARMREFLSY